MLLLFTICFYSVFGQEEDRMDKMWGEQNKAITLSDAQRGELFRDGNYAMFIHWGLYANIANKYKGKTYYGISEWIMNPRRANIPPEEYKTLANDFNPVNFDAASIAKLAKDAGMKYIIITSKHHDGFAMYDSDVCGFNITDATPFGRDPMKELAEACKKEGIGFGFYYSQFQDWTAPGGGRGPTTNSKGDTVSFDEYFYGKCLPQVNEITTKYGDIVIIWFDTPGNMPKKYSVELMDVVHENQASAFVSSRIGHGLGDYRTMGDMEVPRKNIPGLWETVDVTNDSWGYAWYDENWKSPKEILERLISTVGRGGTYMLNIGPRGDGTVPENAVRLLEASGKWITKYPQVIYKAESSPWEHELPWGDVTTSGDKMFLSVYDWPRDGILYLPGLDNQITSAYLLDEDKKTPLEFSRDEHCTMLNIPPVGPEDFVSVIELTIDGEAVVDPTHALDPELTTEIIAEFAKPVGCKLEEKRWMEKFGEWKRLYRLIDWKERSKADWEVVVIEPGYYQVELNYTGDGSKVVWSVDSDEGYKVQNQQSSAGVFHTYPMGWMRFDKAGKHTISVSLVEGDPGTGLAAINFTPIDFGE